ncbi:hypothetical protein TELCIR_09471 [Teladorsagia circumcincta]|uniref:Sushi domain-containing protein n=1 Tax=Teladorsagia circumcincta TaxID=45464 RepID=A0A2G9UEQ6_TELCI|nr:hypothetical protein TELCIR_09471 [Teladorsagia circumcincta]
MKRFTLCLATITALIYSAHALNCPPVAPPLGGTTSFTGEPREGAVAVGQCPLGQILNGPSIITCTNGAWSPLAFGICSPAGTGGALGLPPPPGGLGGLGGLGTGLPPAPGTGLGGGLGTGCKFL